MRQRSRLGALGLALALLLLCPSCARMLQRDHLVTWEHVENPPREDTAYRVETYPALVSALGSYVEAGMEAGALRVPTTYAGDLRVDLEKARRHMMGEDPLGAYALEDVSFHISRIIAYYEVELTLSYRVDASQLDPPKCRTQGELQGRLADLLQNFDTSATLYLTACPQEAEAYVSEALQAAYDATPQAAMGLPELELTLYPDTGTRRIAEVELRYPLSLASLQRRAAQARARAEILLAQTPDRSPQGLYDALRGACEFDSEGGGAISDVFLLGRAGQEGLAHGYQLLCQLADVPCSLVRGPQGCVAALDDPAQEGSTVYLDAAWEEFYLSPQLPIEYPPAAAAQGEEEALAHE